MFSHWPISSNFPCETPYIWIFIGLQVLLCLVDKRPQYGWPAGITTHLEHDALAHVDYIVSMYIKRLANLGSSFIWYLTYLFTLLRFVFRNMLCDLRFWFWVTHVRRRPLYLIPVALKRLCQLFSWCARDLACPGLMTRFCLSLYRKCVSALIINRRPHGY